MNDRFKFRVWNGAKYYCENNFILPSGELGFFVESMGYPHYRIFSKQENFTIEQCTGLRDKNGKLIYEGDVVSDMGIEAIVGWYSDKYLLEYDDGSIGEFAGFADSLEIIGNIHERKEDA